MNIKIMRIVKKWVAFLCFIFIMWVGLVGASKIMIPKWGENDSMQTYMMRGFYSEKKDSIQVLNIGDSDVYRGVSPNVIWNQAHITSYTLASSSQRMWQSYYLLKHALAYQTPKAVFLEVNAARYDSGREIPMMHQFFDNMRLDKVKWEALNDPVFGFTNSEKFNFILPVFEFHSRYKELDKEDFTLAFGELHYAEKGFAMKTAIKPYKNTMNYMDKWKSGFEITPKTLRYLDKITALCKAKKIKLVLFKTPEPTHWRLAHHRVIAAYAKKHNLPFYDFNSANNIKIFDMHKDTMDHGTHLNVYGAEKLSRKLAEYMSDVLKIKPTQDREVIKKYQEDSETYQKDRAKAIQVTAMNR